MPVVSEYFVGIDLGGTNLRTALFRCNGRSIEPVSFLKHNLKDRDPEKVVEFIVETVNELSGERKISGIGIGVAAMIRADDQMVIRAPNLDWTDFPLKEKVSAALGCPAQVLNDVNAIAWGEYIFGLEKKYSGVLAVFMGTGIGGGLILDGKLVQGSHGVAAEIGHVKAITSKNARMCGCGKSGCIEAYLGGKNLSSWIGEVIESWDGLPSRLSEITDSVIHAGHIDEAAAAGDELALSLWSELSAALGLVLANAVTIVDCDVLLMGGTVWENCPFLRKQVLGYYNELVNEPARAMVVESVLGDKAGLYGAAHRAWLHMMEVNS
ncbi:MAG: ROK family protein [Deltaproteobacteria bacterium]|nr:ROK family protein [Deltaproteobacteria bacterium]